jgi:transcriptional regulator with XRE-family HTH domain
MITLCEHIFLNHGAIMSAAGPKKSFGSKTEKDPFAIEVGLRIKKIRDGMGLSQRGLAERLGLSSAALAQYEIGARSPSNEVLLHIARGLGTSVDYLLGATDQPQISIDKEVVEAFESFGKLSPHDRQVVMEIIRVLKRLSKQVE